MDDQGIFVLHALLTSKKNYIPLPGTRDYVYFHKL